jgi:spore coat polysaccharide biosynthesis protein SpsF (cytidylyltransferase family)/diketogulonate reductase-like aldo/keto reductase
MPISKLTLGTAQLGLDYGIANRNGKPDFNSSINILNYSWEHGINTFDTAPTYGNSEKIIGTFKSTIVNNKIEDLKIISKLPALEINDTIKFDDLYTLIRKQLLHSLNDLKIDSMPIYLLHNAPDLLFNNGILVECLNQLKKEGLLKRIGVSVYNPWEVETMLNFKEIDIIQVPLNIFDHRLIETGLLKTLKSKNYTIFARSIYLQGLFFIKPTKLPKYMKRAKELLIKLELLSEEFNIDIAKIAFLFVRDIPEIDSLVIGAETVSQVSKNIGILREKSLDLDLKKQIFQEFSDVAEDIKNPSLWNLGKPLLWYLIKRLELVKIPSKIIIATANTDDNIPIREFANSLRIDCFAGSEDDVLDRYYQAAKKFKGDIIVRITSDCPLMDPAIIDNGLEIFLKGNYDYVSNVEPPTYPDGFDVEIFSFEALERIFKEEKRIEVREHVTLHIREDIRHKLGKFSTFNFSNKSDYNVYRLTVDTQEDFELISKLIKNFHDQWNDFKMNDVIDFIEKNPELKELNVKYNRDMYEKLI